MKWDETYVKDIKAKYVYRYLSLEKLIDFLETGSLYFARLDRFEDNLEGILAPEVLTLTVNLKPLPSVESRNPSIPHDQWETIEHDRVENLHHIQTNLINKQRERFVNCWFLGDNESIGMWDLYAQNGFLIKFRKEELQDVIRSKMNNQKMNNQKMKFIESDLLAVGKVSYNDYDDVFIEQFGNERELRGFRKHIAFQHEEEYRIIIHSKEVSDNHIVYDLGDLKKLKFELYANPRMGELSYKTYKGIIKNYTKHHSLKKSKLKPWLEFKNMQFDNN